LLQQQPPDSSTRRPAGVHIFRLPFTCLLRDRLYAQRYLQDSSRHAHRVPYASESAQREAIAMSEDIDSPTCCASRLYVCYLPQDASYAALR